MKSPISLALALLFVAGCAEAQTTGGGNAGGPGPAANASTLIGCIYRSNTITVQTGQQVPPNCDVNGNLVTSGGGGGGGNAAAGPTGSAVPASAGYTGYNSGGNLVGVSSGNPLPVNIVSGGSTNVVYGPTAVGTAAANPPVQIGGTVDGTATGAVAMAAVKPASTASLATDTSQVVQFSPNGTVAAAILSTAPVAIYTSARTIVALDIATVTTGGTAVTALNSGHRSAGGFLQNPVGATINLCINEQGTASGTTSAGATTCIAPGQSYTLAPAAGAVSVITSDSSHPFSGYGLQ